MTRAKFKCESVKQTTYSREIILNAVTTGSPENQAFFATTPRGSIVLSVKNPDIQFEVGKEYYVDFTPAS